MYRGMDWWHLGRWESQSDVMSLRLEHPGVSYLGHCAIATASL